MTHLGARTKIPYRSISALRASRFAVQPKLDGAYAELHLDAGGHVWQVTNKRGCPLKLPEAQELRGVFAGYPNSILVGELEAHTTAGREAARRRGFAAVHLFDARSIGGRPVTAEPYRARRDALLSMLGDLENAVGSAKEWREAHGGRARADSGRFAKRDPRGWRRLLTVPQYPVSRAGQLWDQAVAGELEGLVVVDLSARAGRGKRKVKPVDTIDAVVAASGGERMLLQMRNWRYFWVKDPGFVAGPGDLVEVAHEGWYPGGTPRFARLLSVRRDLAVVNTRRN